LMTIRIDHTSMQPINELRPVAARQVETNEESR
jgi:hypothetical protein